MSARATGPRSRRRAGPLSMAAQEALWAYLFLLPALLGLIVFTAGPLLVALALSLTRYEITTPPAWIGLDNYARLLNDDQMANAVKNTFYYALLVVPSVIVAALALALISNQKLPGISVYRGVFYAPAVASAVGVSLLWAYMFNPQIGVLNYFLRTLGLPQQLFIESVSQAMPSIAVVAVWQSAGYFMVIFLAALYGIPREYYEAAKIDGAGPVQQFRSVTLPLISPAMFFVIVILLISSLQAFDSIYVMTKGGPGDATQTIVYRIYTLAFQQYAMGYGSAVAVLMFLMIMALTLVQLRLQSRWVHYD